MQRNTVKTIVISSALVLLVILSAVFAAETVKPKVEPAPVVSSVEPEAESFEELFSSVEERQRVTLEFPYFIEIDKGAQIVTIFTTNEEGKYEKIVREIPVSSGIDDKKLPDGYYRSKETKHRWQDMFTLGDPINCQYTTRITGNFLFHSMPYRSKNPATLNASAYNKIGTRASGGCVRMTVENAKWIYDNIKPGTTIHVVTGPERPEDLARILPPKLDKGAKWDPSDPDPANPDYKTMYPDAANEPQPDPYAELYPYNFKYSKDIPVTPQKTTTTKPKDDDQTEDEQKPAEEETPTTTPAPAPKESESQTTE